MADSGQKLHWIETNQGRVFADDFGQRLLYD